MENNTLNLVQDLKWAKETSSNGNLGMNAKFTGVLKSIGINSPQKMDSGVTFYPSTIDLYPQGTDTTDPNAKVLKNADCVIYHNNAFDKDGKQRMQVGEIYAGEIVQAINPDGTAKDKNPWTTLSHLTSVGNRIQKIEFGTPTPQVQQAQADLSQVS